MKKLNYWFSIISIIFSFLFFVVMLVFAQYWNPPSASPPQGNVPPPINVGSGDQWKDGRLGVGSANQAIYWLTDVGNSLYFQNRNNQTTMVLGENGNVGIGTTAPGYKLDVQGGGIRASGWSRIGNADAEAIQFETQGTFHRVAFKELRFWDWDTGEMVTFNNGNVGIGTTAPATKLEVQGGALCVRSGTGVSCNTTSGAISAQYFYYISDLRLKTNIQPIENALPRLLTLNGVSYETIYDGTRSLGLIAQEVEKVFPEVVNTDKETGLKWIDYGKLVPVLIEAIKEQQKEIEKLKLEIQILKGQ